MYNLDTNHAEIVIAFEQLGCKVVDNAKVKRREKGQLDLWIGIAGTWVPVEVKNGDKGKLRPEQIKTINDYTNRGLPVEVARNVDDVLMIFKKYGISDDPNTSKG